MRNIHFAPDDGSTVTPPAPASPKLRLRKTAVSPAEEYALRPGEVQPIAHDLAALILSRKGRAIITLKGIVVERQDIGGRRTYWHQDSILCNDLHARDRKIHYVINPHRPDIVHLLDETGRYIESIPEKNKPAVLDTEAQAREAAAANRQINRAAQHLQRLHTADSQEKLDQLRANSAEMQRVVQTLPQGSAGVSPASSTLGTRISTASRKINDFRAQQSSAASIGRAIAATRTSRFQPEPEAATVEDWSSSRTPSQSQPTKTESW